MEQVERVGGRIRTIAITAAVIVLLTILLRIGAM